MSRFVQSRVGSRRYQRLLCWGYRGEDYCGGRFVVRGTVVWLYCGGRCCAYSNVVDDKVLVVAVVG